MKLFQAKRQEDGTGFFIPVSRRAFKTIKGASEAKIGVRAGEWATGGGFYHILSAGRQGGLDEGLRNIPLFWENPIVDGNGKN